MEHLKLEIFDLATKETPKPITSKYAVLPEDMSITITDTSEVFASGDVWSYSFTLNAAANAHIIGTSAEIHGSRLHEQLNKRRARLWVDGNAMYLGYLKLGDEAEVDEDGNIDVSFESGQKTFEDMIEGAKANQVPLMTDVKIGVALWRKRQVRHRVRFNAGLEITYDGKTRVSNDAAVYESNPDFPDVEIEGNGDNDETPAQEYPRMVFPYGTFRDMSKSPIRNVTIRCLNTDQPYNESNEYPYCNVALCYQKYGYQKKDDKGNIYNDYSGEPEAQRGYEYMPANRVNSAPNFYVIYWIRSLMKHLGIYIEENQMMGVEDLTRLFFVNTKCAYKVPKVSPRDNSYDKQKNGKYRFTDINKRLIAEYLDRQVVKSEECKFGCTDIAVTNINIQPGFDKDKIKIKKVDVAVSEVSTDYNKSIYEGDNSFLHDAYATKECFPDVDISEVITAIEHGFGIRFLFSDSYQRVRIVLLRNLFRSTAIQDISCEIVDNDVKVENSVRGFRVTYGNSEDTHFYYKGFADKLPHMKTLWPDESDKHDYSHWDLNADYVDVMKNKVTAFNKTCYVTPDTGNAYIIKVDKDAKRYEDLHPSLFESAGFMDAEDGDCTGEEETIEEINVGFNPAIMNDINMEEERKGSTEQKFALFVDEKMRPRRPDLKDLEAPATYNDSDAYYDTRELYKKYGPEGSEGSMTHDDGIVAPGEFAITSDMRTEAKTLSMRFNVDLLGWGTFNDDATIELTASVQGTLNEGYRLYLQDNFEPNDDGVSPIETHDWRLTLGIMRGSGSDMHVKYMTDPDDKEGNDTWEIEPGSNVTSHPDTCDNYGREWDYNGDQEGIGPDGRVSLKLRAEKPNPYFDQNLPETHYDPEHPELNTNPRYLEITNPNLLQRGLCDQFYKEYSYWTRNARIVKRTVHMELAQLLAIDKTKKVRVGDVMGFIRKMQYSVSNKSGLGDVTMEIMYI